MKTFKLFSSWWLSCFLKTIWGSLTQKLCSLVNEKLSWVQSNLMILNFSIKTKFVSPKMETERALRKLWKTMWKHWRNWRFKTKKILLKMHRSRRQRTKKKSIYVRTSLKISEEQNLLKDKVKICNKKCSEISELL